MISVNIISTTLPSHAVATYYVYLLVTMYRNTWNAYIPAYLPYILMLKFR